MNISLTGASQAEVLLLGLALKNHINLESLIESGGIEEIHHPGIKQVLQKATEVYKQAPEKFYRLAGLLASFVNRPDWLISNQSVDDNSEDPMLIKACLRKMIEQKIEIQRKALTQELLMQKGTLTPEREAQIIRGLTDLKKEQVSSRVRH